MTDLTAKCISLEAKLSPDEQRRAADIVLANGWRPGSNPPPWVWLTVFRRVLAERPSLQEPVERAREQPEDGERPEEEYTHDARPVHRRVHGQPSDPDWIPHARRLSGAREAPVSRRSVRQRMPVQQVRRLADGHPGRAGLAGSPAA